MAKDLSNTKERKKLSTKSFAFPGKRKYPIPDKAHARNALARVAQNGTPAEVAAAIMPAQPLPPLPSLQTMFPGIAPTPVTPQQEPPVSKSPSNAHEGAPTCSECGMLMVPNGACYKCENCGSTSGCS